MKFIKNGIIYEPHNEFVIAQMQKSGYRVYDEKEIESPLEKCEKKAEKPLEKCEEEKPQTKKKKK